MFYNYISSNNKMAEISNLRVLDNKALKGEVTRHPRVQNATVHAVKIRKQIQINSGKNISEERKL